eukprot:SM000172S03078  [mRNA]  locus=s172:186068:186822:+ [translate_table: standard]
MEATGDGREKRLSRREVLAHREEKCVCRKEGLAKPAQKEWTMSKAKERGAEKKKIGLKSQPKNESTEDETGARGSAKKNKHTKKRSTNHSVTPAKQPQIRDARLLEVGPLAREPEAAARALPAEKYRRKRKDYTIKHDKGSSVPANEQHQVGVARRRGRELWTNSEKGKKDRSGTPNGGKGCEKPAQKELTKVWRGLQACSSYKERKRGQIDWWLGKASPKIESAARLTDPKGMDEV